MQRPTVTIEHEGEEFTVGFDEWYTCGDCGNTWENTSLGDTAENAEGDTSSTSVCPQCGNRTGNGYSRRREFYTKYSAVPIEDPPLEVDVHTEAIRKFAKTLEALAANGWEITQSDGVHIYLETTVVEPNGAEE